ncbi:phosphoglycerate kinase [Anaeroplasma bactoclasticum]|jgi:phosphoglycerate kinase|uniref:Phosphoglycerate kinase n=1 Tax=Anaeroplasma bactoclasticum TaxID=2088 RepID=A0A397S665_9MOLU|nr:phosphoglycerate kinase [Anaeroplasma bactoclasticum]RIA78221.1 phosphoglycerate kinase [Anaeroplasma bactoclasticum]
MAKKIVSDLNVKGKKVLIRVDFNVPMKDGKVADDTRIKAALPTIQYVIENGGRAIVFSHLGRVKSADDIKKNDITPVAKRFEELIGKPVKFVNATRGAELEAAAAALKDGEILMFANTRNEDFDVAQNKEVKLESKNNAELGAYWASLGDVFVNDAFGTAHRAAASNVGIASNVSETASGFLLAKEIKFIGGAVDEPVRPYVAILGGSKVSDKIGVINALLDKADKVLVGGAMMFTFLKAEGYDVKASRCEDEEFVNLAKELLAKANGKIVLPVDAVVNKAFEDVPGTAKAIDAFEDGDMGLDIGPKTLELFAKELAGAKTVVWNGPMGVFEMKNYAAGTVGVCELLAKLTAEGASTIIGGGDSAAAAEQLGYASKVSHISTGGGASLEYLEGKVLPGIACVDDK